MVDTTSKQTDQNDQIDPNNQTDNSGDTSLADATVAEQASSAEETPVVQSPEGNVEQAVEKTAEKATEKTSEEALKETSKETSAKAPEVPTEKSGEATPKPAKKAKKVKKTRPTQEKTAEPADSEPAAAKADQREQGEDSSATQTVEPEHLDALEEEVKKLSIKNTAELFTVRNKLNKLRKLLDDEHALNERADELHKLISEMVEQNQAHQEQLQTATVELIEALQKALDAGQSHDALPAWDRIQGNISNTSGKIRNALQELSNPFKARINELRDWKIFAATEKKRELITQMEQLIKTELSPHELNKHISKLHNDWKSLGRSNDNDKLWKEFKTFSDKAYAPVKEFFKQRKAAMAENLKKRRELCDSLEEDLSKLDPENIHVGEINKVLSHAESEWKKHAPVEQSKIKSLQKRYYELVNQFRKHRKASTRGNAAQKQALIDQIKALVDSDNHREAIETAKRLQKEWKEIGPTSFKEDKKYWSEFRGACDKIFENRNQQSAQRKSQAREAEGELKKILKELEALLVLEEERFRETKNTFHTLAQQFNSSVGGKLRQTRSKQIERFNELKRKIDNRFQALPDKKTQILLDGLQALDTSLCELEDKLFNASDDSGFTALTETFDQSVFDVEGALPDAELKTLLEARAAALNCKSAEQFNQLAQEAQALLRKLCVESEIRAGLESPADDQSLRMKLQLEQLQDGFGQSRPSSKENIAYSRKLSLQQYCIGPISKDEREALRNRLTGTLARLF